MIMHTSEKPSLITFYFQNVETDSFKVSQSRILSTSRLGRLFFEDPGEEQQKTGLSYCGSRRFAPSLICPPIKSESRSSKVPLLCVAFGLGLQEKDDDKEQENEGIGDDPVKPVEKEEEETDGFEDVKPVECPVQEPDIILQSPLTSCEFCGSKLTLDEKSKTKKGLMSVYTRDCEICDLTGKKKAFL